MKRFLLIALLLAGCSAPLKSGIVAYAEPVTTTITVAQAKAVTARVHVLPQGSALRITRYEASVVDQANAPLWDLSIKPTDLPAPVSVAAGTDADLTLSLDSEALRAYKPAPGGSIGATVVLSGTNAEGQDVQLFFGLPITF